MALAPNRSPLVTAFKCPSCNSTDLKRVSLIHAAGVYESRGSILGAFIGSGDGLLFGRYRGKSQSRLSKTVAPPKKMPYAVPTVLWLLGFFVVMAFVSRGKLTTPMTIAAVAYMFLLPALLIGTLAYNLFIYPKKQKTWEGQFLCQRCGTVVAGLDCANTSVRSHV